MSRSNGGRHPGKRLSPWRVSAGVVVVLGLVGAAIGIPAFAQHQAADDADRVVAAPRWFGGYFDVTAAKVSDMPDVEAPSSVVLSFIVAAAADTCEPSWGTYYSMDGASTDLDLDRRIARLRQGGAEVAVSFGGAINTELGGACTTAAALADAYGAVVERYSLSTIDLDIEGVNLSDEVAGKRRAEAVALLQAERRADDEDLGVWITLPVAPTGLTAEGITAVEQMLTAGVDLAGVNVMTMDYGVDLAGKSMADASMDALTATHRQLSALYDKLDVELPEGGAWSVLGATPMIGQNDVESEVFDLDDAADLNAFAADRGLERMSMWSLNRDRTCGPNYPDTSVVSNSCSGVEQRGQTFAEVLSAGFDGRPAPTPTKSVRPTPVATDNPETSPYPIWADDVPYSTGIRVVWRGNVYAAKWWVQGGSDPDDPTVSGTETAWTLIGPVLPTDEPWALPTLPAGTYPDWTRDGIYEAGARVLYQGTPFVAQWWTQGDNPMVGVTDHDNSPWGVLTE